MAIAIRCLAATYYGGDDGETFGVAVAEIGNGFAMAFAGSTTSTSLTLMGDVAQDTLKGTQDAF